MGQFVSQGLLRRESLSILRACYVFMKRKFKYGAKRWGPVTREIRWMMSVLPTMEVDSSKAWSEKVWVFDASEWGEGIMFSYHTAANVREVGGFNERVRFKNGEPPPRTVANQQIVNTLIAKQDDDELAKYMSKLEAEQQSSSRSRRRYARAALSFASHIDTSHYVPCVPDTMTMAGRGPVKSTSAF